MSAQYFWCEHAWLPQGIADGVRIQVEGQHIVAVTTAERPEPDDVRLVGLTLPGAANAHSHAFHRALRGAGAPGGTFWGWRDTMYRIAQALTPERYYRLARAVYAEMLMAGYTSVAEFHYVHHQADGTPYDDPNAMGHALQAAAAEVGIRLTLLDTCYLSAGFGQPLEPEQLRFSDGDAQAWKRRVSQLEATDTFRVGAAIHSVRAVDEASMRVVADWAKSADAPLHVHLSEQQKENEQCLKHTGLTPTALLDRAGALSERTTGVHAVHMAEGDLRLLEERQAAVCICPSTEADLADGIAPAVRMAEHGVRMGIGSDQNVCEDPFSEVRDVEMHERLRLGTRENFTPQQLLEMMSGDGQRIAGWPEAGRIEKDALADWTVLDLATPITAGSHIDRVPQIATAGEVHTVIVGGRTVVDQGTCCALDPVADLVELCPTLRGE